MKSVLELPPCLKTMASMVLGVSNVTITAASFTVPSCLLGFSRLCVNHASVSLPSEAFCRGLDASADSWLASVTVPVNVPEVSIFWFTVISLMVGQASRALSRTATRRTPSTCLRPRSLTVTVLVVYSCAFGTSFHSPPWRYWTLLASKKFLPPPWTKVTESRSNGLLWVMPK